MKTYQRQNFIRKALLLGVGILSTGSIGALISCAPICRKRVTATNRFKRITLNSGEKKTIEFELVPDVLSMLDIDMKWIVEPGTFEVMIDSSSEDIRLRGKFEVVK